MTNIPPINLTWTLELKKNIEKEERRKLVRSSCHHKWVCGRYMAKHCEKCGKLADK